MPRQNKKPTILLYLTHLFVYSIVIWEGFLGGRGREQRYIFLNIFNGICSMKINSIEVLLNDIYLFIYHNFSAQILPTGFSVVQWIVTI